MKSKEKIIVTLITFILFCLTSIGYATYSAKSTITGQATLGKNGDVYISSAILTDYKNVNNPTNPVISGKTSISFDIDFFVPNTTESLHDDYYSEYTITITNDSLFNYSFNTSNFTPSLNTNNDPDMDVTFEIDGIELNDIIPSKETRTLTLTIIMYPRNPGDHNVSGDIEIGLDEEGETGSLLGSIPGNIEGDLKNNTVVPVTATIINTYEVNKNFNIVLTSNSFELVDSNGNPLSTYTISNNTENTYTFYIKVKNGAVFRSERQSINIYLKRDDDSKSSMGVVTLLVNKEDLIIDNEPPVVNTLNATFQSSKGNVLLTYSGTDNIELDHYNIYVYKDNNLYATYTKEKDTNEFMVTNLSDGNYHFKVEAVDTEGLTGSKETSETEYRWTMNVSITINRGGPNGNYTVDYGETYTTTITANNNRTIPTTLNITMGGNTLNNNSYTYRNGNLSIPNVTGDLVITGETGAGGCLVEGTKVLLANYETKNIEDIDYNDLLLVWSYEEGKLVKEFPIWIEKEKEANNYIKITFSDNSTIKVHGSHAFFSTDYNEFIDYQDNTKFKIGTSITKIDKDGKQVVVRVKNIETINEKIKYYFVASTRYYNIISDNFITTDGYTDITNLYEFNNNITWNNNRNIIKIDYDLLKDILPYYLFKGFRAEELGVLLYNERANLNGFKLYIERLITSSNMIKSPLVIDGNRYHPVLNELDNKIIMIKEGDNYKLPINSDIKSYYNTSDNKYYLPGEEVVIWTGTYFDIIK